MALYGAGFEPADARWWLWDDQCPDGPYSVRFDHADGREMVVTTGAGNGWQAGRLRTAVPTGPWRLARLVTCTSVSQVRRLLLEHEPDRESTYECGGGVPIRQVRALDGREREIVARILSDIIRACRSGGEQELLLRLIRLDGDEARRLLEIRAVLETRAG